MKNIGKLFFLKNFVLNAVIAAVPLFLFALPGRLLDKKHGTSPWYFLIGLSIAFFLTFSLLGLRTWQVTRKFAKEVDVMKRENSKAEDAQNKTI